MALVSAAPDRVGAGASGENENSKASGNGHPAPSTILVVEDEVLIRLSVCDFLRECGYRVLEAGTGEDAQSIFESGEPIEVLFSDIDLGHGINGFALATWVRSNYPTIRTVLASGVTRMAREAAHLCDAPFLDKPYSYEALADHIKRLLSGSERRHTHIRAICSARNPDNRRAASMLVWMSTSKHRGKKHAGIGRASHRRHKASTFVAAWVNDVRLTNDTS
jgi:DNA-binding NtrC family response regulator